MIQTLLIKEFCILGTFWVKPRSAQKSIKSQEIKINTILSNSAETSLGTIPQKTEQRSGAPKF